MAKKSRFDPDGKWGEVGPYLSLLIRVGVSMIVSILFFFFTGLFLVRRFHLSPIFIILFLFVGIGCGFYMLFREISKVQMQSLERSTDETSDKEGDAS